MSVALFNTHAFVKRLTAAGMPEIQAEILADENVRLIDERLATKADLANHATKADIGLLKTDIETLKADVGALKSDLANTATKAELAEVKADILKWMFGTIGFQTVVILGAVVLLLKFVKP